MVATGLPFSAYSAVIKKDSIWPSGTSVKVCFFDGSIQEQQQVGAVATAWSKVANIGFDFGDPEKPRQCQDGGAIDVRVSLKGTGDWSYLGQEAGSVPAMQPTLTLGDAVAAFARGDMPRFGMLVLHEFGHALGFLHELQSPNSPCEIDLDAVELAASWSREMAEQSFGKLKMGSALYVGPFDPKSVMMYEFTPFLSKASSSSCYLTRSNSDLSAADKAALLAVYGPPVDTARAPVIIASDQFRKTLEQARILTRQGIETAVATGFAQKLRSVDPDRLISAKLRELSDNAINALAVSFPEAIAAFHKGDFTACQRLLIDPANNGDSNAELILAEIAYEGPGTLPADRSAAAKWLSGMVGATPGADKSKLEGAYLFALMNEAGIGVPKHEEKAIEILNALGGVGYAEAYLYLGRIYLAEQGAKGPNVTQAAEALRKGALQGNIIASLSLAILSIEGFIPKDDGADLKAVLEAAANSIPWARFYMATLYADGVVFTRDSVRAKQMLETAATDGLPIARTVLGLSYEAGLLHEADLIRAAQWYSFAAQQEDPVSEYRLALLIMSAKIERDSYSAPAALMLASAQAGFSEAQYRLGLMYRDGLELPQDNILAATWLIIATAQLSGLEQQQAQIDRDQLANRMSEARYAQAQERAESIYVQSPWSNPEAKSMPPIVGGIADTHDFSVKTQGTGFLIAKGFILSNYHVVQKCDLIVAKFPDGASLPLGSPTFDKVHDLALMKVLRYEETDTVSWRFDDLKLPIPIRAAGFPLPTQIDTSTVSLERGDIAQPSGPVGDLSKWRITARIHKGNSGGPLLDDEGNVIGVAMGGLNDPGGEDIAFAFKGLLVEALFGDFVKMNTQTETRKLTDQQLQTIATRVVVPISCMIHVH
jgi:TPR repeat protein